MMSLNPQFITNAEGEKLAAVLSMQEYEALLEELEMLEDVQRFEEVTTANEPVSPVYDVHARVNKQPENDSVPEWQQQIVAARLKAYYAKPDIAEDFETALSDIEKEL